MSVAENMRLSSSEGVALRRASAEDVLCALGLAGQSVEDQRRQLQAMDLPPAWREVLRDEGLLPVGAVAP